ncbi:MAG: diguanylate cyclase [Acidobacteriota bacterium]|nr:diguanylate cyclase [Acidobacteriota bacterium]
MMVPKYKVALAIIDNELNLMCIKTVFQFEKIQLLEARDFESGLKILRLHKPDIVLIDRDLKTMDICAAVQTIRKEPAFEKIPILAYAAKADLPDSERVLKSGINGIISKPILSRSFLEEVKKFIKPNGYHEPPPPARVFQTAAEVNASIFDALTGLFNSGYIKKTMDLEMKRASRHGYSISLMKIDVDRFKAVNAKFGPWMGDLVLREIAEIIRISIREIDVAARMNNDEFLIVLPYADRLGAVHVAKRIFQTLRKHTYSPGIALLIDDISICMGIATCPQDATSLEDTLKMAESRLQKARESGLNRICVQETVAGA